MSRFRMGLAVVALTMTALAVPGAFTTGGGVADAAPIAGGDITLRCAGTTVGSTFTLTADCGEVTSPLFVPNGFTVEGGGHVITATDPDANTNFNGGIVTNAPGATEMHVNNVIIRAVGFAFHDCAFPAGSGTQLIQVGLLFEDAGGTATNVTVRDITQDSGCQTGNGIRANARSGTARTVTLTNVTVTGFQKNGVTASGRMTLNVGGASTIGPPDAHPPGGIATNSVQYGVGGAGGTFAGNTVFGSGFGGSGSASVAMLVFDAANLTIDQNTITGVGTDIGISVTSSDNVTISNNAVGRTAALPVDLSGTGIRVDAAAASLTSPADPPPVPSTQVSTNVSLICNTFSGWQPNRNIVGAVQMSCTPLPNGTECTTYSADIFSVEGGTAPFTWSVSEGTLPPGLTLAPSTGAITGTPTAAGTYSFTVTVVDSTGLTATQAQTITIAPGCAPPTTPTTPTAPTPAPPQSTVQVVKTWVGTPSTTTIFVDANGQAPYDASVVADTNGATTSFTYPVSTSVTVGETTVPTGFTATIDCGQGAQPYSAPITVNAPATGGAILACRIVNTANPAPPPPTPPPPSPRPPGPPTIEVDKSAGQRRLESGKTMSFTIAVRARGTGGTVRNVQVCDVLPDGLVFVSAPGARFQNGQACWRIAQLSRRRSMTFRVTVRATRVLQRTIATNVATLRPCSPRSTASAGASRCNDRVRVVLLPSTSRVKGGGVTG